MATIDGSIQLVKVVTDAELRQNGGSFVVAGRMAQPIQGFDTLTKRAGGGNAIPVYVVSDAQIANGTFRLKGGSALPMADIDVVAAGVKTIQGAAIPVYVVSGSLGAGGAAYDWYVDSANGNDANTGKSEAQAFATIGALTPAGFAAGESVGLAKGSHWREKWTITAHSVTVEGYGTGNRPIIDATDILSSWSKTGGQTNVYESSPTIETTLNYFVSVFQDGLFMTRVASVAACDAAAGSYFVENEDTTSPTVYVHATGSGNPASNGSVYEATARLNALYAQTANDCTFRGLDLRGSIDKTGAGYFGASTWIEDCYFRQCNQHNVLAGKNSTFVDCTAQDNDPNYGGDATLFVGFEQFIDPADTWTFIRCNATGTQLSSGVSGYLVHRGTSEPDNIAQVTYTNCSAFNTDVGIGGEHTDRVVVSGGTFSGHSAAAISSPAAVELVISDIAMTDCANGIRNEVDGVTITLTNVDHTGRVVSANTGLLLNASNCTADISGGTWTSTDPTSLNQWLIYVPSGKTGNTVKTRNWSANQKRPLYIIGTGNAADFDDNAYGSQPISWRLNNTAYSPLSGWQAVDNAATGGKQDANSTQA